VKSRHLIEIILENGRRGNGRQQRGARGEDQLP
jgi:hypothetical protein